MPSYDTDVLICGAGAAGLTLAIDLARRGVRYRLIDRIAQPFGGSRGKGIQPRTLEVFEDLGFVDALAAIGGPYPPQREYKAGGIVGETPMMVFDAATPDVPYPAPIMIPQFLTEGVMRARLAELGGAPDFGVTLLGFDQDDDGVSVRVDTGTGEQALRVRYLIGTDGGRSTVRHELGIDFPGETLGVRALVADAVLDGLDRTAWHRFQLGGPETQVWICPLAGTDLFQIQAPVPMEGDADLSAEGLTALTRARTGRSDILIRSVSWASAYMMNARLANRYRVGRVFLAGDAAHIHPPTGGQGLNTSVQDSYNLGWKLAAVLAGAPDTLLDSYESERRTIAAGMLGLATRLLDQARQGTMTRGRETQQLDLAYPDSPLSRGEESERIRAGDRAPDAPCRGAAGQATRLFALFRGPHWTLLGYEVDGTVAPRSGLHVHRIGADGDIIDDGGHIARIYGLSAGQWVLVRPDGYVAGSVTGDPAAFVAGYL
ncbi:FAD-dependent oxidoreductase [Sphingomonas sp. MMS24-J13]|uniref:FAD-dependent oxidoreductase n=1 Tax=Sphingomonas sp. MMS24-J13 TaxID=3238686 RepID=UPI0038514093